MSHDLEDDSATLRWVYRLGNGPDMIPPFTEADDADSRISKWVKTRKGSHPAARYLHPSACTL